MIDYIDRHGLDICGDIYEEYPLNEVCVPDENNFLIRVIVSKRSAANVF
jgi:effector-binding domain-containing protein